MLAAETIHRALADGADLQEPGALSLYDAQVRNSEIYHDLRRYRNMRQAFQHGLIVGGALGGAMDTLHGDFPPWRLATHPDADQPVFVGDHAYGERDGTLTFDKLSSVFASGNRSRDDQPDHLRIQRRVPRELAIAWTNLCPAQVYEVGAEGEDGLVELEVTPSNCVQCGAITAKGGRLTPPEGGSGPEYTLT
jgi:electron-transferring-flavoprotein dehydrogenase